MTGDCKKINGGKKLTRNWNKTYDLRKIGKISTFDWKKINALITGWKKIYFLGWFFYLSY